LRSVGTVQDITDRYLAEQQLRVAAAAFESQEGMVIADANNVILRINRAFTEITGYSAEEAVGQTPKLLKSGRHDAAFFAAMWASIKTTGAWHGEIWNRLKNNEVHPHWITTSAVHDRNHRITHYVGTYIDITERKQMEEQVRQLAFYDPLTKLPNRRLLNDRLQHAMAASRRTGLCGAVMILDLDNFKSLNDTHGHLVGDLLLVEAARRLSSCLREMDTEARFGGDEFVVLLTNLAANRAHSTEQAAVIAEKIRVSLSTPYVLTVCEEGKPDVTVMHRCSASIGVVIFMGDAARQEDLLKWADAAMYRAKEAGRNAIRFYGSVQ
jgi:diguanylate cyclase (GGDEF)-like protein/PAS domain S-box-containing protein